MVASGNDFVILDSRFSILDSRKLVRQICDRKFGIGADGVLVLAKSRVADVRMRIFNADGSEAEMCGNGARCVALYRASRQLTIETKAGIIQAQVKDAGVKIKLTDPKGLKLDLPIKINNRTLRVNFINTGVPHAVIFSHGLDKIDVFDLGRLIRKHQKFAPSGTNADFVEVLSNNTIKIRTYERGVEDETLACGTGAVACALITAYRLSPVACRKINVITQSKEVLKVYFSRHNFKFSDVWLEGKAGIVYTGVYNV